MRNKQKQINSLVQEIGCPYGANTIVRVQDYGRGLTIQCMYAKSSSKKYPWADKKMEEMLKCLGCPKSSGRTRKFRYSECPFNEGIARRL